MVNLVTEKSARWTRGSIAKQLQIHPETLRYYEVQRLIKKPLRSANNYRTYSEEDRQRLKFILAAKELGFSLKEIKELLNLSIDARANRAKVRVLAQKKSELINNKIDQLQKIKAVLDKLIKVCRTDRTTEHCPILKSISGG
jgi:DNA-binding transcriptional MerR regulator